MKFLLVTVFIMALATVVFGAISLGEKMEEQRDRYHKLNQCYSKQMQINHELRIVNERLMKRMYEIETERLIGIK